MLKYFLYFFSVRGRWGLVAAPHDVSGPPIDVSQLPRSAAEDREKESGGGRGPVGEGHRKLANAWAAGTEDELSLWWVSYAAQPCKLQGPSKQAAAFTAANAAAASNAAVVASALAASSGSDGSKSGDKAAAALLAAEAEKEAGRKRAQELGVVSGEHLLERVSKDALGAGKR